MTLRLSALSLDALLLFHLLSSLRLVVEPVGGLGLPNTSPFDSPATQLVSASDDQRPLASVHQQVMSCYVCSTMDYDNTGDNQCKKMTIKRRLPGSDLHQQTSLMGHYPNLVNYNQGARTQAPPAVLESTTSENLVAQDTQMSPLLTTSSNHYHQSQDEVAPLQQPEDSAGQLSNASPAIRQHMSQASNNRSSFHNVAPSTRPPIPPLWPIRTRQCSQEEHFCSVVSVVRLEIKNELMQTKFWALERNCSKSCNTGCLLIGEKIRLRVCSLCCRTPDCNSENGSALTRLVNVYLLILASVGSIMLSNVPAGWRLAQHVE